MSLSGLSGRTSGRPDKQAKASKVLLVCVYDTIVFELTNEVIRKKFQKFGHIIRILIFEKGQVTKFFVEYDAVDQAINAKTALDGTKLCENICKMTIYFSNFTNVDLKHDTSEGVDYVHQEEAKSIFVQKFDMLTKGSQKEQYTGSKGDSFNDHDQFIMCSFDTFGTFSRSKTDDPRLIQRHIQKLHLFQHNQQSIEQEEVQTSIKKGIESLLQSTSDFANFQPPIQKVPKLRQQTAKKSEILSIKVKYQVPNKNIYNLFSNFGNISWIINRKSTIFIKFRSVQFAAIANTYLNNTFLMGNLLIVESFAEDQRQIMPVEGQYAEMVYYDNTFDRFTPQRSITINPPTQTLHVSSIKKQLCREQTLRKIFSQYGAVDKVKVLHTSNEKNMALVKFYSTEDSFFAISELHNRVFMGRKMQISFTKSRI